jgi:hypothetical protein
VPSYQVTRCITENWTSSVTRGKLSRDGSSSNWEGVKSDTPKMEHLARLSQFRKGLSYLVGIHQGSG